MRVSDNTIKSLLFAAHKMTDEQLARLQAEEDKTNRPFQDLVVRHNLVTDRELIQLYADYAHVPFIELNPQHLTKEQASVLPEHIARQYNAVVFGVTENGMYQIAMEDPDDLLAIDFIRKALGPHFKLYIATKENILQALEVYRGNEVTELDQAIEVQREEEPTQEKISTEEISEDSPIAKAVNLLLEYAIRAHASDVHIEPREEYVQVRYRNIIR